MTTGCVKESMNVEFDKDNGSQAGHIDHDDAGDDPPSQAIRTMGIGELIPLEEATDDAQGEGTTSTQVEPSTSTTNQENAQEQEHDLHQHGQEDNQEPSSLGGEQEHQEPSTPRTPLQSTQEQEEGNDEDICVGKLLVKPWTIGSSDAPQD